MAARPHVYCAVIKGNQVGPVVQAPSATINVSGGFFCGNLETIDEGLDDFALSLT